MAKVDLRWGYRSVPIHKDNYEATGVKWKFENDENFTYFYDTRLPFGARKRPSIFQRITQSVGRIMKSYGYTCIVYLDDFLVIEHSKERCQAGMSKLVELLINLGFTINWKKLDPPTQKITFLGIEIDSNRQTLRVPSNKLQEIKEEVKYWLNKKSYTKKQLQRIIGQLNYQDKIFTDTLN